MKKPNSPKRSNWPAIVLSILAATIFWFFQSLNKNYSTNITYPITFDFPRENYVIMDELPSEVQVNISGIGWNIFRKTFSIGLDPIHIPLDNPVLTRKIVGAALLANVNDQLSQFQVNYIISDTLYLNIEPKAIRKFGVYVDSLGIDLKENHRITSAIETSEDSVTVSGPASIIEQLPSALPISIKRENIDEPFDESVPLEIRGYQQSLLQFGLEDIAVSFDVEEYVTVSYRVKLTTIGEEANMYAIDSMVSVYYSVPRSAQASLEKDSIKVVAIPQTLNEQDSTVELSIVSYPEEIFDIKLDTTAFKVIYE